MTACPKCGLLVARDQPRYGPYGPDGEGLYVCYRCYAAMEGRQMHAETITLDVETDNGELTPEQETEFSDAMEKLEDAARRLMPSLTVTLRYD